VLAGSIPISQAIIDVASKVPAVAVGGRGLDLDLPHVDVLANDNHLGGTLAVRHLIEFGHTRIAHISGLPSVAARLPPDRPHGALGLEAVEVGMVVVPDDQDRLADDAGALDGPPVAAVAGICAVVAQEVELAGRDAVGMLAACDRRA
jgi:hypothetical protein